MIHLNKLKLMKSVMKGIKECDYCRVRNEEIKAHALKGHKDVE